MGFCVANGALTFRELHPRSSLSPVWNSLLRKLGRWTREVGGVREREPIGVQKGGGAGGDQSGEADAARQGCSLEEKWEVLSGQEEVWACRRGRKVSEERSSSSLATACLGAAPSATRQLGVQEGFTFGVQEDRGVGGASHIRLETQSRSRRSYPHLKGHQKP